MIIDKIKFKPGYAKEDSKTFASAGVEAEGLAPERIWRNMTNISNWNRYYPSITDIDFDNPSETDPHIYDKAQFHFDLADGNKARCQVICFTHPKDDRVGRIAVQGTVFDPDGKRINEMVLELMVGVPDGKKCQRLTVAAAVSCKEEIGNAPNNIIGDKLLEALNSLVDWSKKHN